MALLDPKSYSYNVLVVGDGNFSFTVCFASALSKTCVNRWDIVWVARDFAVKNIEKLSSFESVEIMHEVDATALRQKFGSRTFDRVIFNFPLTGGKSTLPNREIWWAVLCKHRAPRGTVQRRYLCKPLSVSGRNALRQSKKGAWKLLTGCLPSCESWLVFVCLSFF